MTDALSLLSDDCEYRRPAPGVDRTVSFRPVELPRDLDRLHAWLTSEHVRPYWEMGAPLPAFRRALSERLDDDHVTPYVGRVDGVPMSYFERYWAAEDPLADHYDARDGDQGIHLLIGPEEYLGRGYGTALLRSMADLAFRHPGTDRVVAEPDARNDAAIRAFERVGFRPRGEFRFPHEGKDATLLVCERARFERSFSPGALAAEAAAADADDPGDAAAAGDAEAATDRDGDAGSAGVER
ncbi:GNAT family N-acetyltransferase [Halobaculum sp. EA56]|uniref:GNAT family N-acetyltransferase n=1 Tax=Halobaculum sp. EA56 TaxID=3421648 RepID=UPI003EBC2B6F